MKQMLQFWEQSGSFFQDELRGTAETFILLAAIPLVFQRIIIIKDYIYLELPAKRRTDSIFGETVAERREVNELIRICAA